MNNVYILKAILGINNEKATELLKISNDSIDKALENYEKLLEEDEDNICKKDNRILEKYKKKNDKLVEEKIIYKNIEKSIEKKDRIINLKKSFFDNTISESIESNIKYMKINYNFYIPFEANLYDINNFLCYIYNEINLYNRCIYCGKIFQCATACIHHIKDKNHFAINIEIIEDIEKYYNLSNLKNFIINKEDNNDIYDLVLPNKTLAINKNIVNNINKNNKRNITNKKSINNLLAQEEVRKNNKINYNIIKTELKFNKKAVASQYIYKEKENFNKQVHEEKHHRGLGGGGSHFWLSASKQQLKGVKIKNIKQRRGGKVASIKHQSGIQD